MVTSPRSTSELRAEMCTSDGDTKRLRSCCSVHAVDG
jgi:hypothetical protein